MRSDESNIHHELHTVPVLRTRPRAAWLMKRLHFFCSLVGRWCWLADGIQQGWDIAKTHLFKDPSAHWVRIVSKFLSWRRGRFSSPRTNWNPFLLQTLKSSRDCWEQTMILRWFILRSFTACLVLTARAWCRHARRKRRKSRKTHIHIHRPINSKYIGDFSKNHHYHRHLLFQHQHCSRVLYEELEIPKTASELQ